MNGLTSSFKITPIRDITDTPPGLLGHSILGYCTKTRKEILSSICKKLTLGNERRDTWCVFTILLHNLEFWGSVHWRWSDICCRKSHVLSQSQCYLVYTTLLFTRHHLPNQVPFQLPSERIRQRGFGLRHCYQFVQS